MLLTAYTLTMVLATGLMAAGCWIPALLLISIGLGLSVWCWRNNRRPSWDGVERRATDRNQRVVHLQG